MKELTVKEIQEISLVILKAIHIFCKDNGIAYSVIGGTLLGTIRHKGFIPWDDDIDIMMPRPDYERFCEQYQSVRYKLLSFHNDKSCMIAYARVCDMTDTIVMDEAWTSKPVGVWIDVFPFDGADDDYEKVKSKYSSLKKIWSSLFYNRALEGGVKESNSQKLNIAIRLMSFFHVGWINQAIARRKVKSIDAQAKNISFGAAKHVSQFAFLEPGYKEYFTYEAFKSTIELPFEDMMVCAIEGYNEYLSKFYGNYMELPPVEKSVPKQDYLRFYWRDDN